MKRHGRRTPSGRRVSARILGTVVVSTLLVSGAAPPANSMPTACRLPAQTGPLAPRPSYTSREHTYAGTHAVVHYVVEGRDAPPLASFDLDSIPDYVEIAAAAADLGVDYYGSEHPRVGEPGTLPFVVDLCDSGAGGDTRPDIYIRDIEGFGLAVPPTAAEGGAFVQLSPRLNLTPETVGNFAGTGVRFTVLHELFHLVQFTYVPSGMPAWIAEGTANAMAVSADGAVSHPVLVRQLDRWLRSPHVPIHSEGLNRERSYGGIAFWYSLARYVPAFFETLRARYERGQDIGLGLDALRESLMVGPLGDRPILEALEVVFHSFAIAAYVTVTGSASFRVPVRATLRVDGRRPVAGRVAGMAAHFVRLRIPRRARVIRLSIDVGRSGPEVSLLAGVGGGRARPLYGIGFLRRTGRMFRERSLVLRVRNERERAHSVLVLTNATDRALPYALRAAVIVR